MMVKELIGILKKYPANAKTMAVYEGQVRDILTVDYNEGQGVCLNTDDY
jgi:hypothetical protein